MNTSQVVTRQSQKKLKLSTGIVCLAVLCFLPQITREDMQIPEPQHVSSPPESVKPAPSEDMKPEMKVGDDVCIHSRSMGDFHVTCRIVGGFAGRYQLYCSKGVLNTSFSFIPVTGCFTIPLDEWRKAPIISLHSMTNDSALHERCNCCVPQTSESIVLKKKTRPQECG